MPTNTLNHISGQTVIEYFDSEEMGHCTCVRPVRKIIGSNFTNRTDGIRYARTDDTEGWGMFTCDVCHAVISKSYVPDGTIH